MLWRGNDPFAGKHPYNGPIDLPGWGSHHPYLRSAIEEIKPAIVIQVGVSKGGSTIPMAAHLRDLGLDSVVIAIDTWLGGSDHWINDQWFDELGLNNSRPGLFQIFCNNVRQEGLAGYVVPFPLDPTNAAKALDHFKIRPDLVHIDAGHDYQAVLSDLRQWWPALKPGGILIGDDYRNGNPRPDVKRAFDDYFKDLGLTPIRNTGDKCLIQKPPETSATLAAASIARSPQRLDQVASEVRKWRELCRIEFNALATDQSISGDDVTRRYINFIGPNWNGIRREIMDRITRQYRELGLDCSRRDLFTDDGRVRSASPSQNLSARSTQFLQLGKIDEFEVRELLPSSSNPFRTRALPKPINKNMARTDRPALEVYCGKGLDLFVSPLGYQLCDEQRGVFWQEASTRAYPLHVFSLQNRVVDKPVVIIQDTFEGTNFSHFLFDWIPRLAHFLAAGLEDARHILFVMGGAPGEFHGRLIEALCATFGLAPDQFVFPTGPEIWRSTNRVYFFSDARVEIMHPAHMAHERSVEIIRQLTASIKTAKRDFTRIYISRADTPLRQVANEIELWNQLKKLGFVMIWLAQLPLQQQIELVRGAEVVVAPHGMGLTHIAFHDGKPLIVELHHPEIGTDAYAFMANALGFRYRPVIGKSLEDKRHHFEISLIDLLATLAEEILINEGVIRCDEGLTGLTADYSPRTSWFGGVQEKKAEPFVPTAQMNRPYNVLRHLRGAHADNNLGWIEARNLAHGLVYSTACDVWIPEGFNGRDISLSSHEFLGSPAIYANMNCRDQWQTLRLNGVAKAEAANAVLRSTAEQGELFYSANWRTHLGTGA